MAGTLRRAWSWLKPGGQLAVTVWGEVVLAPGEPMFWDAVRREDPALQHISPADRLAKPGALEALFAEAGVAAPAVVTERWRMPLATPEAFWPVIMGTSNRGVFDGLSAEAQTRVKRTVLDRLRADRVDGLDMEALIAIARKGPVTEQGLSPRRRSTEVTDPAGHSPWPRAADAEQITRPGGGTPPSDPRGVRGNVANACRRVRRLAGISGSVTDPTAGQTPRCCCPTARRSCRRRTRSPRTAGR